MAIEETPFGTRLVAIADNGGRRTLRASIIGPNDHGFVISNTKLVLGGIPLTLYFSSTYEVYALAAVDVGGADDSLEMVVQGTPLQTRLVGTGSHTTELDVTPGAIPMKETIIQGIPIAVNTNNEMIFVEHVPAGTVDETIEAFVGGIPLICRRYGEEIFFTCDTLVPQSSSSSSVSSSSSSSSSESSSSSSTSSSSSESSSSSSISSSSSSSSSSSTSSSSSESSSSSSSTSSSSSESSSSSSEPACVCSGGDPAMNVTVTWDNGVCPGNKSWLGETWTPAQNGTTKEVCPDVYNCGNNIISTYGYVGEFWRKRQTLNANQLTLTGYRRVNANVNSPTSTCVNSVISYQRHKDSLKAIVNNTCAGTTLGKFRRFVNVSGTAIYAQNNYSTNATPGASLTPNASVLFTVNDGEIENSAFGQITVNGVTYSWERCSASQWGDDCTIQNFCP